MALNNNADDYTVGRVGMFFPASSNGTGNDGDLTGQCVTLNKWFLAEMCQVPAPFSARGHARSVGRTLVQQGLAYEVTAGERKRGDFVVYEYGDYGHIGVLLSGNRLFQQNAQVAGVASKIVAGGRVYASTIVNMYPSLGGVAPKFYRVKSYVENINNGGSQEMPVPDADNYFWRYGQKLATFVRGRQLSRDEFRKYLVGQSDLRVVEILSDDPEADRTQQAQEIGQLALRDKWQQQIYDLQALVGELGKRPTQAQLDEVATKTAEMTKQLDDAKAIAEAKVAESKKLTEKINEYELKEQNDKATADNWLRRLGQFLAKYLPNSNSTK